MKWLATALTILLPAMIVDRSVNLGFTVGYYGELNKLTTAFRSLPGVSIQHVGYNPDLTLEEIWFRITDAGVRRDIEFGENDPIRELSGKELKAALANGLAMAANYPKDSRLSMMPAVAIPACDYFPKPYSGWTPDVVEFSIILEDGVTDSAREGERLARKHGFAFELKGERGRQYLGVAWLEPEQVAALRCEDSVRGVGFARFAIGTVGAPARGSST